MPDPSGSRIYTVSELTVEIRRLILGGFDEVAVSGEISNFSHYPASGHMYFSLKDAGAAIRCVFFRSDNESLTFVPENGMQVVSVGKLDVYQAKGEYQLKVSRLLPQGAGALAVALEQLKKKLAALGLFDPARKRPLPFFPRRIGVITSTEGAAIRDIFKVGLRRWPGACVLVHPVPVEGAKAAPEIAEAIRRMGRWGLCDVLIVGRGGGSIEDLWAFNEEVVCKAAAACPVPVVSAVGHEKDVTLLDLVADVRAATPSNAAEIVFPEIDTVAADLASRRRSLARELKQKFALAAGRLDLIRKSRWWKEPKSLLETRWQRLDDLKVDLARNFERRVIQARQALETVRVRVAALSPTAVLERGYALLTDASGSVVRRVSQVSAGDRLSVRVSDGTLKVLVDSAGPLAGPDRPVRRERHVRT
ncbi:MAG: exodeoxyribonuclease VII large subunit [Candidatus Lindowbacteria bacterium RIFCSPLOWO2_12_FULL_62_27]|nr:MAG: exodeoxyribonuclease VII large subunit [Candidatus Lindowbacteria bacterium RIFCSPLOWO2_12_FULL_62_27]OGH62336.1 MAG: exodeoxyribonuclease VII large subunit [Candidatus Lindowbacteria bacterium RIFCSPLOWO2_02_FULL_62_12]